MNKRQKLEAFILAKTAERARKPFDSLEQLICSPRGFGLTTATDLQRAICRIVDGKPLGELAEHPHVLASVGDVSAIDGVRPDKIVLIAGIRTFKSLLTAGAALWAALDCDVSGLGPGEMPRFPAVSLRKDLADVILRHLTGAMLSRPELAKLLIKAPTADSLIIRHPSGTPVEVKVTAGARAGGSLVARWLVGVVHDEAPRMLGQDEGVVNLQDSRDAVEGRMLPGAQQFEIGSPWAPYGPVYETVTRHEGKPSKDCVVIRARADWLNPVWWTPARAEKLKRKSPRAYQTDFLAMFADPEETLFPQHVLDEIAVGEPQGRKKHHEYEAAMDPATRTNAWTMVIFTRGRDAKVRQVLGRQWHPRNGALRPKDVLREIGHELRAYGLDSILTDQWGADFLVDLADEMVDEEGEDLSFSVIPRDWTAQNKTKGFLNFSKRCEQGEVELLNDPLVRKDLLMIRSHPTASGVKIEIPKTPDGRHCDFAPAIVQCTEQWLEEPGEPTPEPGTPEFDAWLEAKLAERELEEKPNEEWWNTLAQ